MSEKASDAVKQRLLDKGSLARIPKPLTKTEIKERQEREPIRIKGKPLSRQIIEDRR